MIRLWRHTQWDAEPTGSGAAISVFIHGALIFAAVVATAAPVSILSRYLLSARVVFLPPPNRQIASRDAQQTLAYVDGAPTGARSGFGEPAQRVVAQVATPVAAHSPDVGDLGLELATSGGAASLPGVDSVFTRIEVDSVAVLDPTSAAPAYPPNLLKAGIEGRVDAQYVVDSTGKADPKTFIPLESSRPEFVAAVRAALPNMHFTAARIGERRVRQVVRQEFKFQIQPAGAGSGASPGDSAKKPPRPPR